MEKGKTRVTMIAINLFQKDPGFPEASVGFIMLSLEILQASCFPPSFGQKLRAGFCLFVCFSPASLFLCLKLHSFHKQSLSSYYMSCPLLGAGNTALNKGSKDSWTQKAYIPVRQISCQHST